ncbi:MAG TPA: DEAD/DEAH box helicase [Candidatus Nanoarchaeia archaeon]|nr:DEAD/DEAH box helicase [Candidatus Nanoarchaeia archaeon]
MKLEEIRSKIPRQLYDVLSTKITDFRPSQEKSINAGLLDGQNLLVCTPTASGKTLIAELAGMKAILEGRGKAVYIVPLKALASEKYKDFKDKYGNMCKVAMSIGDVDRADPHLSSFDFIITTSEKLDSLMRHHSPWIMNIAVVIVDEVHLLNDAHRGPTLEILLTMLRQVVKAQVVALSATIGNPQELASWLDAKLIEDEWRPVELKKGVYLDGEITFY